MKRYKVKELAAIAGVTPQTLRRYDELGIIHPVRDDENQYRLYQLSDLTLLIRLRSLRNYGFSLSETCGVYRCELDEAMGTYDKHVERTQQEILRLQQQLILAKAQRERLEDWKKLSQVPFELRQRPECVVSFYRSSHEIIEDSVLLQRMNAVLPHMPPMRSCGVRKKESFLAHSPEYYLGLYAYTHEVPSLVQQKQVELLTLPACLCMAVALEGKGTMLYPSPDDPSKTQGEYNLEYMHKLLHRHGFQLAGDTLTEVLHMCQLPQDDAVPHEHNFHHYQIAWIPVQ